MRLSHRTWLYEATKVRGYMKPAAAFHMLAQWEELVLELLELQGTGIDSHGGDARISLWNEYITTPIRILEVRAI